MYFKIFNLLFFIAIAGLSYINIYFKFLGFTPSQIGLINGIAKGVALLTLPIWGLISDYYRINKRLLMFAIIGMILFGFSFLLTDNFLIVILIMTIFSVFWNPITPLADAQLLGYLGKEGSKYGKYRIWGSLGYTISVAVVGYLLEIIDPSTIFYLCGFTLVFALVAVKALPESNVEMEIASFSDFKFLLKNEGLLSFIVFAFFINITFHINNTYFPIYLIDQGGKEFLIGLALMISAGSEMVIFYFSEEIISKFKLKNILLVSSLAYALRWFILSIFAVPSIILTSQLLHSITFGLFHVTAINFINLNSGDKFKATGQNLYATTSGISAIFASLIGGVIYDKLGGSSLYLYLSLVAVLTGIIYFIFLNSQDKIKAV
ncbi:PPP family 3-phenylpropionic acid transporter [Orenia metallireducens]|uniref:MFS transporter, PPP family, 3-phenylpropionic acid transporter n=1 Tax=Orenia metallireducens TaxID=1413210 RepID=A0A285FXC2_9FIRM|nr:MFS transporter [Orenia metallireducens]PRX35601.1 PPP family 3-phenylpropionic acid transporter [Orenia metallireducens]SNY15798.1 MFS transporter, PPP family, 3-phenylpropionic acid transporter [Orenia metallireducens]